MFKNEIKNNGKFKLESQLITLNIYMCFVSLVYAKREAKEEDRRVKHKEENFSLYISL